MIRWAYQRSEVKKKVGHQEKNKMIAMHYTWQRGIHEENRFWVGPWRMVRLKATQGSVFTGKVFCIGPLGDATVQEFSSIVLFCQMVLSYYETIYCSTEWLYCRPLFKAIQKMWSILMQYTLTCLLLTPIFRSLVELVV